MGEKVKAWLKRRDWALILLCAGYFAAGCMHGYISGWEARQRALEADLAKLFDGLRLHNWNDIK
jgi:hypothetical protein